MITLYSDSSSDGFKITIIAQFGWVHIVRIIDLDFSGHNHLNVWHERFAARSTRTARHHFISPCRGRLS